MTPGLRAFAERGDIRALPPLLKGRLLELAARPHTYEPMTVFSEADDPGFLVQFYNVDTTGFQPNIFTTTIPGINDGTKPTATGPNGDLPTIGTIRVVLEPKPGLPTDPNDPRAFIDMFTDVSGLFVINNEAGWYEGWVIRDIKVPVIAPPRANGRAQYGTITPEDAAKNAGIGTGNNAIPGRFATTDGKDFRPFSVNDVFPEIQSNGVPIPVSLGTFNALQQSDIHAYWEFNPGTNFIFPHYELPFTGGTPGSFVNRMARRHYVDRSRFRSGGTAHGLSRAYRAATTRCFTAMIPTIQAIRTGRRSAVSTIAIGRCRPIPPISKRGCALFRAG